MYNLLFLTLAPVMSWWFRAHRIPRCGIGLACICAAWIGVISWGCFVTWQHSGAAARTLPGSSVWPASSLITPSNRCWTMLLFAHPRCPCTRATLRELERLLAECPGKLDVKVLLLKPHEMAASWAKTDLWSQAEGLPGAQVFIDEGGTEAARFGASCSGEIFIYDVTRVLRFQGGITPARGHEGDAEGHSAIVRLIRGETSPTRAPVFGCSLNHSTAPLAPAIPERL